MVYYKDVDLHGTRDGGEVEGEKVGGRRTDQGLTHSENNSEEEWHEFDE